MLKQIFCVVTILFIHECGALSLPEGAPISKSQWQECEEFIQHKAPNFFSQGIFFLQKQDGLPCPIKKDVTTQKIYILLDGQKNGYIGKGSHKVVKKAILYSAKPQLVAHCLLDQDGAHEAQVLQRMTGLRGVMQGFSYIAHSKTSSELFVEYFNYGTFNDLIYKNRDIPKKELLLVMMDLIIGLKGMHERGYIHRDIKTANIFLKKEHDRVHAALGDVGLALAIDLYPDRMICIPNPNCPPEVLIRENRDIDRRKAETYSLGVILYVALYHRRPSWSTVIMQGSLKTASQEHKRGLYQKIQKMFDEEVSSLPQDETGVRKGAVQVVFKMLNPVPKHRTSLHEALAEIRALYNSHY